MTRLKLTLRYSYIEVKKLFIEIFPQIQLFLLTLIFVHSSAIVYTQNSSQTITLIRDNFVQLYPSNSSVIGGVQVKIKILPNVSKGCQTENIITMECLNCLNNSNINYISFDLLYVDCTGNGWRKTISLPANSTASKEIGGKTFQNNQREQVIFGVDPSNKFNSHFTYNSDTPGEVVNIRVTNNYLGGSTIRMGGIQMPSNIYAENNDGTPNTSTYPAEYNTEVTLRWDGGNLPAGGRWNLYKDDDAKNAIYQGNANYFVFTARELKTTILFTLKGIDKNGIESAVQRDVRVHIAATLQIKNEITRLINSDQVDEADQLCAELINILGADNSEYKRMKKLVLDKKLENIVSKRNNEDEDLDEIDAICQDISNLRISFTPTNCSSYKITVYRNLIQSHIKERDYERALAYCEKLEALSTSKVDKDSVLKLKKDIYLKMIDELIESNKFDQARNIIKDKLEPLEPGAQYEELLKKITKIEDKIIESGNFTYPSENLEWNCREVLDELIEKWKGTLSFETFYYFNIKLVYNRDLDKSDFEIIGNDKDGKIKPLLERDLNSIKYKLDRPTYSKNGKTYTVNAQFEKGLDLQLKTYNIESALGKNGFSITKGFIPQDLTTMLKNKYRLSSISSTSYIAPSKCDFTIRQSAVNGLSKYAVTTTNISRLGGPGNAIKSLLIPGWGRAEVYDKTDENQSYKKWKTNTFGYLTFICLSVGSKLLSNDYYKKFENANDQQSLDRNYSFANTYQRIALSAAGVAVVINLVDVLTVFNKGIKNNKSPLKFKKETFMLN